MDRQYTKPNYNTFNHFGVYIRELLYGFILLALLFTMWLSRYILYVLAIYIFFDDLLENINNIHIYGFISVCLLWFTFKKKDSIGFVTYSFLQTIFFLFLLCFLSAYIYDNHLLIEITKNELVINMSGISFILLITIGFIFEFMFINNHLRKVDAYDEHRIKLLNILSKRRDILKTIKNCTD